jgi:capsid protein
MELDDLRTDYLMAKRSGAQKRRISGVPSQGAGADFHYRNESDFLWMGELAREIYRNNMICQSFVERAIDNHLQDGFAYDPDTGDAKLDLDLSEWWTDIVDETSEFDPANELAFSDQTEIVLRSWFVDGDIFGVPLENGTVDLREFHLCRSPTWGKNKNIVHGVEKDPETRRRTNYHFLDEPVNPNGAIRKTQLTALPAYDEDGERNIFHVRNTKRSHQTRGLTSFAPIFDVAGMHDDVQFLKIVQQRASSLWILVRKRAKEFDPAYLQAESGIGVDVTAERSELYDSNLRQYREVSPGSVINGLPGEEINPWSASIPNPEFFPQVRMLLTFISINFGMPYIMSMMDASEANFSSMRGAVEQARLGFRRNQAKLIKRWHRPVNRFKIFKKGEKDKAIQKLIERSQRPNSKINIFKHRWHPPTPAYIDPYKDAAADLIQDANMQTSPRRRCRSRGAEWSDIARETVEDRAQAIELAVTKAADINSKNGLKGSEAVRWRDLAPLPNPDRVSLSVSSTPDQTTEKPSESGS